MTVGKILVDFSTWTSAHGLPHVGSAQSTCLRVFWSIVFVASCGMFIFQMVLLVDKYMAYDVTVSTELKFEERDFPAVTVCNLNPYIRSRINATATLYSLMNDYERFVKNQTISPGDPWKFSTLSDSVAVQAKAREWLQYKSAALTTTQTNSIVYGMNDFVVNCAYNTRPCVIDSADSDFRQKIDPLYGACYTFNFKADPIKYKSTRAGPLYGLRLLLKSDQKDYLPLTESAGVRVTVHGQKEEPFPDAFGYNAAAGFTTSFGVKFIRTKRLPAPYGNCTNDKAKFQYAFDGDYTIEGCFRSCLQAKIIEKCSCGDPRFNVTANYPSFPGFCKDSTCVNEFTASIGTPGGIKLISACGCPQPCTESTYGVTVSTALWPSEVYVPPECRNPDPARFADTKACTKWYGKNTMLIEVYYERMNYQQLTESEAYGLVNLISDMGGQLGLWMGISVITMVEFASLLILLCLYCCSDRSTKEDPVHSMRDPTEHPEKNRFDNMNGQTPPPPYGDSGLKDGADVGEGIYQSSPQSFANDLAPPPVAGK